MFRHPLNISFRGMPHKTGFRSTDAVASTARKRFVRTALVMSWLIILSGCGAMKLDTLKKAFNLGKFKGIESTAPDEAYYLLTDIFFTGGSSYNRREDFDHTLQDAVSLVFKPANEKGHYVTKSVWYDPSGVEYRTMRQTHDKQEEQKRGETRAEKGGTNRMHTLTTQELYEQGPGRWKVELFIDDKLARRMELSIR